MTNPSVIIGIDGGGTKSRVLVGNEQQFLTGDVKQYEIGPGNFREIGVEGVRELARQLKSHFKISNPGDARVIAGFAGAGTTEARIEIANAFKQENFSGNNVTIMSDASLILAALKNRGVVLIAGTGGICIGRNGGVDIQSQEGMVRAGGYGYRIDSEASSYYLGRRALDVALKLEDGRIQESSVLYDVVKKGLRTTDLKQIADVIYPPRESQVSPQALIAALAPDVLETAANGDNVAVSIVGELVAEMADHVQAVCSRLKIDSAPVALYGGLFKSPHIDTLIIRPLHSHNYLSSLNLSFRTVGMSVGDLDALFEALKFILEQEQITKG